MGWALFFSNACIFHESFSLGPSTNSINPAILSYCDTIIDISTLNINCFKFEVRLFFDVKPLTEMGNCGGLPKEDGTT